MTRTALPGLPTLACIVQCLIFMILLWSCGTGTGLDGISSSALAPDQALSQGGLPAHTIRAAERLAALTAWSARLGFSAQAATIKLSTLDRDWLAQEESKWEADRLKQRLVFDRDDIEPNGSDIWYRPVYHVRPMIEAPAPYLPAYESWPLDQRLEWYFLELAGAVLPPKSDPILTSKVRATFALHLMDRYMSEVHGNNAALVDAWRMARSDRWVFTTVAGDLAASLRSIMVGEGSDGDRRERAARYLSAWVGDFQSSYPRRFQTNAYKAYGSGSPGVIQMLAISQSLVIFKLLTDGELGHKDAADFVREWSALPAHGEALDSWVASLGL